MDSLGNEKSDNILLSAQTTFEHNEGIIASIVENIQLGRYDDCIKQYSILQSNLMGVSIELDSYPPVDSDPYEYASSFPDELSRKEILDDLKPLEQRLLPEAPIIPSCIECYQLNVRI